MLLLRTLLLALFGFLFSDQLQVKFVTQLLQEVSFNGWKIKAVNAFGANFVNVDLDDRAFLCVFAECRHAAFDGVFEATTQDRS